MRVIVGLGVDVVDLKRVDEKIAKRVLTEREMEEFDSIEYLAGRFALKEAFFKAIGTGLRGFSFKDLEFLRDDTGRPVMNVKRDFPVVFNYYHASLSHDLVVVAVVVLEKRKGGIIVTGDVSGFEVIGRIDEETFEIDSPYGLFKTMEVLESRGSKLLKFGNLWGESLGP